MKIAPALRMPSQQRVRIVDGDLHMLGSDTVGQRHGLFQIGNEDDRAEIAPACCRRLGAVQRLQLAFDRLLHRFAECGIIGDQDRLGN